MYLKEIVIWFLRFLVFLIVLASFVSSIVFAVITVIPEPSAGKANILGYKSHCSFVPISTIILAIIALVFGLIFVRIYGKRILQVVSALRIE